MESEGGEFETPDLNDESTGPPEVVYFPSTVDCNSSSATRCIVGLLALRIKQSFVCVFCDRRP